jgi:hypothetical protein
MRSLDPIPNHRALYGAEPKIMAPLSLASQWDEFLHYLYLPVRIPYSDGALPGGVRPTPDQLARNRIRALPRRLRFLDIWIDVVMKDAAEFDPSLRDPYVYVTARRGFASPGNPLNRPGWHCDDFGGTDLNYIWSDEYPTRFLIADKHTQGLTIPKDDTASMETMTAIAEAGYPDAPVIDGPINHLMRLTPYVIHDTPIIPAPGGMRSFFKISVSTHRYNLVGNSHNHGLDYDWRMYDRQALRNQPEKRNGDYVEEPVDVNAG